MFRINFLNKSIDRHNTMLLIIILNLDFYLNLNCTFNKIVAKE